MSPPPPPEELIEEILLRFPPQEPASLVRAALVCKRWCRLVSGAGFRRRFRELHRTPPMLGFLLNVKDGPNSWQVPSARFMPTAPFCVPHSKIRSWSVLDARHGHVLLERQPAGCGVDLMLWDPVTKEQREVPAPPPSLGQRCMAAAVVCSVTTGACDHLDCHNGPFLVVLVVVGAFLTMDSYLYIYSSESATWSNRVSIGFIRDSSRMPSVCLGNALYLGFGSEDKILKYDLQSGHISRIKFPVPTRPKVFTTMKGGELEIATIRDCKLYIWSREDTSYSSRWIQTRAIKLEKLLPADALFGSAEPYVAGVADSIGVVFLWANTVLYTVHVKTREVKKLYKGHTIYNVVPYMSIYTPALGAPFTGEGASAGGSSA